MMGQNVQKVLQALGLRSDVGTVNAVKKAFGGNGSPFPFEGDALIDGTLNIDFTETLDFITGDVDTPMPIPQLGVLGPELFPDLVGKLIGSVFEDEDGSLHSGVADGNLTIDIGGDDVLELPIQAAFSQYGNEDNVISQSVSKIDLLGELQLVAEHRGLFNIDDADSIELSVGISKDDDGERIYFQRIDGNGDIDTFDSTSDDTGFTVKSLRNDPEANIFKVVDLDNASSPIFQVRKDGIFLGDIIPSVDPEVEGQLWLDGDTLKVSGGPI